MGTRRPRCALALACLLVLAGCSSTAPGSPLAAPTSVTTPGSTSAPAPPSTELSTAPSTGRPSVQRPAPIDLSAVDICRVVGSLPRREFGLDDDRPPVGGPSLLFPGSNDCATTGIDANVSMLAVAVVDRDAPSYAESANVATKAEGVAAGYPMAVLTPHNPDLCIAVVDVHDGQMLYVSYSTSRASSRPAVPQRQLCETVADIAAAAVGLMR